ncbi:MAG: ribosome assembly RNA-binding protein YhbY [Firmicutes bacterium HGW-Firmicutes-7]|nr:MAG: ribosome assembly RNA-binding protein YhbY [Firmicutes bacterium HGW-Firmicutes-7]
MTSKQRAYLRGLANLIEPIYQVGKAGLGPEVTEGISDALEARELVKINVLKNCLEDPREMANILSERTRSDVVQQIGRKIVLYRPSKDNKTIELPK